MAPAAGLFPIFCGSACLSISRHWVAAEFYRAVRRKHHFKDLIRQVALLHQVRQNEIEKTLLPLQVQPARSIDTDQSRVQGNTGINAVASRVLRRPTKVRSVIRDERPISFENGRFQFPILQSRKTQVIDV